MRDILHKTENIGWIIGGTYYNQIWSAYHKLHIDDKDLAEELCEHKNYHYLEGPVVEFELVKNPNYSWHNNEPEYLAKIIKETSS